MKIEFVEGSTKVVKMLVKVTVVDHYFVVFRTQENVGIWLASFHMVLAVLNRINQEFIQELRIIKIGSVKQ
jgi:hypothetical protein